MNSPAAIPDVTSNWQRLVLDVDGLDQLRETVAGADLHYEQLRSGRLRSELMRIAVGPVVFDVGRYSLPIRANGCGNADTVSIVLVQAPVVFNDLSLDAGDVMFFPAGAEFEGIAKSAFANVIFTVRPEELARFAEAIGSDTDLESRKQAAKLPCLPADVRRLTDLAAALEQGGPHSLGGPAVVAAEILACLCHLLASSDSARTRTAVWNRQARLIRRAEALLTGAGHESDSLSAICAALEVSARTLQLAFQAILGMGPQQYSRIRRLHAARRDLLCPLPGAQITDIALRHGFSHLGRFSTYYREFFGEMPSETLRRVIAT